MVLLYTAVGQWVSVVAASEVEGIEGIMRLADKYGVSLFMLSLFIFATIYILHRLLNGKSGILTGYVRETIKTMATLGEASQEQSKTLSQAAETQSRALDILERFELRLEGIERVVTSVESQVHATIKEKRQRHSALASNSTSLALCFREACRVAEEIAGKLEISEECRPYILEMQRHLDTHVATVSLNPEKREEKANA